MSATAAEPAARLEAGTRRHAVIHRMAMAKHTCPFGLKALHLLRTHGFTVEDRPLRTREEVDRFKASEGVKTTPQIAIDGVRVGGHDDLRRYLGLKVRDPKAPTYAPVAWLFGLSAALALALSSSAFGSPFTQRAAEWAVGIAMVLLALQKLRDVESFATMFLSYDLLAQRWVPYGRVYPYAEALAGLLMVAGALNWLSVPIALLIGGIGAVSVVKAVYVDRREIRCACVGGDSNVPLGFVSLLENVMMVGMGVWMLVAHGLM